MFFIREFLELISISDQINISDEKIDELVDAFMDAIPALLKSKLQAA